MPRGDGTGPAGFGPMTGRAAGFCAGYQTAGFANFGGGRGAGFRGRGGFGRGFRAGGFYGQAAMPAYSEAANQNPAQEQIALKNQAEYLEKSLESIKNRLAELEEKS